MFTKKNFFAAIAVLVLGILALSEADRWTREFDHFRRGHASTTWDKHAGTVEFCGCVDVRGRTTFCKPAILYRFNVGGRVLWSHHIEETSDLSRSRVNDWYKNYPKGAKITVYYEPNSGRSILKPGVPWSTYYDLAHATISLVMCSILILAIPLLVWAEDKGRE